MSPQWVLGCCVSCWDLSSGTDSWSGSGSVLCFLQWALGGISRKSLLQLSVNKQSPVNMLCLLLNGRDDIFTESSFRMLWFGSCVCRVGAEWLFLNGGLEEDWSREWAGNKWDGGGLGLFPAPRGDEGAWITWNSCKWSEEAGAGFQQRGSVLLDCGCLPGKWVRWGGFGAVPAGTSSG